MRYAVIGLLSTVALATAVAMVMGAGLVIGRLVSSPRVRWITLGAGVVALVLGFASIALDVAFVVGAVLLFLGAGAALCAAVQLSQPAPETRLVHTTVETATTATAAAEIPGMENSPVPPVPPSPGEPELKILV